MLIAFCAQPPAIFLHSTGKFPSCYFHVNSGYYCSLSSQNLKFRRYQKKMSEELLGRRIIYRIREASRREDFKLTKKQKRGNEALATETKIKQPKEVEIKVGLAYVNDGVFKARQNKTHILKVKNDIERDELIEKAFTKHANFDQSFDRVI